MIHRLALLMGGTGAAGVLAVALALGGFGSPLPNPADGFAPVANDALGGGQRPPAAPTDQPTMSTSLGGGSPQDGPKKVVDTVYVAPAPAVHRGKPANDAQPTDQPGEPRDDNGGNQAGDESDGSDDQAGQDDNSGNGDYSDDGGGDDGGQAPGDD